MLSVWSKFLLLCLLDTGPSKMKYTPTALAYLSNRTRPKDPIMILGKAEALQIERDSRQSRASTLVLNCFFCSSRRLCTLCKIAKKIFIKFLIHGYEVFVRSMILTIDHHILSQSKEPYVECMWLPL